MKSDDAELQRSILEELEWRPGVSAADIGVTVKSGAVTLRGKVDNLVKKQAIERAVKEFPGVKAIAADIEVEIPGHSVRTDSDIALAAENALKWNVLIPRDQITAVVDHGFLTLRAKSSGNSRKWRPSKLSAISLV